MDLRDKEIELLKGMVKALEAERDINKKIADQGFEIARACAAMVRCMTANAVAAQLVMAKSIESGVFKHGEDYAGEFEIMHREVADKCGGALDEIVVAFQRMREDGEKPQEGTT